MERLAITTWDNSGAISLKRLYNICDQINSVLLKGKFTKKKMLFQTCATFFFL